MRSSRGVTLLEALVAIAVLIGLSALLLVSFLSGSRWYVQNEASMRVQQEARRTMDAMAAELPQAGHMRQLTDPPGSANTSFTGSPGIAFQILRTYDPAACSATNNLCWGDGTPSGDTRWLYYVVDTTARQLVRCDLPALTFPTLADCAPRRILANDLQALAVDYDHSDLSPPHRTVKIGLEIRHTSPQLAGGGISSRGGAGTVLIETVELRNVTTE